VQVLVALPQYAHRRLPPNFNAWKSIAGAGVRKIG
jgi:hypothetical protein